MNDIHQNLTSKEQWKKSGKKLEVSYLFEMLANINIEYYTFQVFTESNVTVAYTSSYERYPPDSYIKKTLDNIRDKARSKS